MDSIAKRLFSVESYEKLSFDKGSYYTEYRDVLTKPIWQKPTPEIISHLVKNEIFGNFVKHSAVTLPLTWRGLFIAKYWGILGFLCFLIILLKIDFLGKRNFLLIAFPAWFMVLFHAFISLNIARYNLFLIPTYSISIAFIICLFMSYIKNKIFLKNLSEN